AGVRPRGPRGGGDRRGSARGQGPVDGRLGTVRERGPRQDRQRTRSGGRDPELTGQRYSEVCALPSERFSTSSEVPASSDPVAPSDIPFLNSLEDLPSDRARSGSFFAPKRKTISATLPTMTHSFTRTPALRSRPPQRPSRRARAELFILAPNFPPLSPVPRGREGIRTRWVPDHGALSHARPGVPSYPLACFLACSSA